ncbi:Ubiquitin-conjugating enzyme subunit [Homalodisca vitripennis]|nr:Ubiquitin-conjugating enzyme subunit [Homalodisca vitripennis]
MGIIRQHFFKESDITVTVKSGIQMQEIYETCLFLTGWCSSTLHNSISAMRNIFTGKLNSLFGDVLWSQGHRISPDVALSYEDILKRFYAYKPQHNVIRLERCSYRRGTYDQQRHNGDLCISILHPPVDDPQSGELPCERWNPTQNVRTILLSVISLLNEPNTFSPANVDASVMYRRWRDSKGKDKEYENIIRGLEEELLLLNWTSAPCRRHSNTAPSLSNQPDRERITVDISISCFTCLEPTNNVHAPRLVNKRAYFLPRFSKNNYNYGTYFPYPEAEITVGT